MQQTEDDFLVVKTTRQDHNDHMMALGECLFAVKKSEWYEFKEFLSGDSIVETGGCCPKIINLFALYNYASILFVANSEDEVVSFLLRHGTNKALKYLRKGTRYRRNTKYLYEIMNKMAIFIELEHEAGADPVSVCKKGYYAVEEDETVLAWKLPKTAEEVETCKTFNQALLEKALENKYKSKTFEHIIDSDGQWSHISIDGVIAKITVPDDTTLWDPDIILKSEKFTERVNLRSFIEKQSTEDV